MGLEFKGLLFSSEVGGGYGVGYGDMGSGLALAHLIIAAGSFDRLSTGEEAPVHAASGQQANVRSIGPFNASYYQKLAAP